MKIELYSLPNYYINKNIILTYTGITALLTNPIKSTSDVNQIDISNVVVNYNYYDFIKKAINYVRIEEKYCYFISNVTMRNNGNVQLTLELDAPHTLEFIKQANILSLVGASYVKRGLSSKSKKYNKVVNTFTFNNDRVDYLKSYLLNPIIFNNAIDVLNQTFSLTNSYKCLYLIVNENWTPLIYNNVITSNYYCYDSVNNIYTYTNKPTTEKGINTNKYFLAIPLCTGFVSTGNFKVYEGNTLVDPTNYHIGASSLDFDLYLYLSELVKYDPTNIIEYGISYLPLGNLNYKPVVLPNANVVGGSSACPMLQITNIEAINLTYSYSGIYKDSYTNVYVNEGLDIKELLPPQNVTNVNLTLFYSITSDFEIKLKVNNLLNEKGFDVFNITELTKVNAPVYIDGVERQALLNNAMIANQKRQQEKMYNLSKDMDILNYIDSAVSLGSKSASSMSKGDVIGGGVGFIGGAYSGIIKNISNVSTREISYQAQAEAIKIRKNNLKYSTSSFTSGQNIVLGNELLDAPHLYYTIYNNNFNKMLYFINGLDVNRVVPSATLATLKNTFISCNLNFNVAINYNIASDIINLFDSGVYIFDTDANALNYINSGLGLTDYDL